VIDDLSVYMLDSIWLLRGMPDLQHCSIKLRLVNKLHNLQWQVVGELLQLLGIRQLVGHQLRGVLVQL
jgi:hypothetical protein